MGTCTNRPEPASLASRSQSGSIWSTVFPRLSLLTLALGLFLSCVPADSVFADTEKNIRKLKKAAQMGDLAKTVSLIEELGRSADPEAAEPILLTLLVMQPSEVLDEVLAALKQLGVDNVSEACEKFLSKKKMDPILQAAILEFARTVPHPKTEKWLIDALESRTDLVVRNAIAGLLSLGSKNAIEPLIQKLEKIGKRRSTLFFAVEDALIDLTGQRFDIIEDWHSWWEINANTFDPKNLEEAGTTGVQRRKPGSRNPEFFGVEIVSEKVMFVIDCSGSMVLYDDASEEGGSGQSDWRIRQRIYRVKNQLKTVVDKLKKGAQFNIISFSNQLTTFNPKGIVPANGKWKKKARAFADGLKANGFTHTDEALEAAFKDRAIDTIILLSDGAPAKQGMQQSIIPEIMEWVRKNNRLRKIKIHTFGFDGTGITPPNSRQPPNQNPEPLTQFLKQLARENGGKYTSIK